jgi:hypothetical protein
VERTHRRSTAIVTTIVLAVLALSTPTAAAAVPTNDDFDDATVITSLPFLDDPLDMTTATRDADDPWWFDSTVWYAFTPATDMTIKIHASQSDFDATVSVWTGSRTELQHVGVWWGSEPNLRLEVTAGTTYYLMAGYYGWSTDGAVLRLAVDPTEPPSNDDFDAATEVTELPFTVQGLDVSDATRAPDDPLDGWLTQTVWYSLTPSEAGYITASTAGTAHMNVLSVWTGQRGDLDLVAGLAWYGEPLRVAVAADTTYYLMVGNYGHADPALLYLSVDTFVPPSPLESEFTIDPTGTVNTKTGLVTVSGTISCSAAAWFSLEVDIHQRMGRFQVLGSRDSGGRCGPDGLTTWSATARSSGSGMFGAGQATVGASGYAEHWDEEAGWYDNVRIDRSAQVRLSPTKH